MNTTTETQMTLLEARGALRAGQRTPPVIEMSQDPREAVAYALAVIRGDEDSMAKGDALAQLASRIERFVEGDSDDALRELAATMPLMEAMMVRYAMEAAHATNVDRKFRLTKLALQCQSSFARTLALLAGLRAQRKGDARIVVNEDAKP